MLDRASVVDQNFLDRVSAENFPAPQSRISPALAGLSREDFIQLAESQWISRHLDIQARLLKDKGEGFYTIGSSGHEGNAAIARVFRHTDMAFLHYRSGAFMVQRARHLPGTNPIRDQVLSLVAAKDDPVSQGRHKVYGSVELFVPPQTSTIASHLPKAMGAAWALGRNPSLEIQGAIPDDSVILCNFGDASFNHATSQSALNTAQYLAYKGTPLPLVFICEDNGIGISVETPANWVENCVRQRPAITYLQCNGLHLPDVVLAAQEAEEIARREQKPVFLHMKTVRLLGHAGSDTETQYHSQAQIDATEANDPLLHTARLLIEAGYMTSSEIVAAYEAIRERIAAEAASAVKLPKLSDSAEVCASVAPAFPEAPRPDVATQDLREKTFEVGRQFKYLEQPRNLCQLLNYAMTDLMLQYPQIVHFGEDVGRKGGVYSVSANLQKRFGEARVFDTLLDETSILGGAIGAAHLGQLPIPEIQFLAYTHNAEDQLRGEAATLSYFSAGQFHNPMVIRIAGLAYQKGFGGHFHNDNSFAFLREMPGVILACPSNGADAARMLRECVRLADEQKRVVVFLEPIALYHTKDLHEAGDNLWLSAYPHPDERLTFGAAGSHGDGKDLVIVSYGNGYYLSRQAQKVLADQHGIECKVVDLRWLAPLHRDALLAAVAGHDRVLIVDECRKSGSLSEEIITALVEDCPKLPQIRRITGADTYIPIGVSWQYVLPSREQIVEAAVSMVGR